MFEQFNTRERRLANERALYRYRQALERGDIETITTILQEASQNAALEQLIYALHGLDQLVEPAPVSTHPMQQNEQPTFTHLPLPMVRSRAQRPMRKQGVHPRLQTFAAILMVLALIVGFISLYSTSSLHPRMPIATQTVTTPQRIMILLFYDGRIQAIRDVTGQNVWSYATGLSVGVGVSLNSLNVQNRVVYAMITNHLYALDENTGHLLWQKTFVGLSTLPIDMSTYTSKMNIEDGIIYITIQGNSKNLMCALSSTNGNLLWQIISGVFTNDILFTANILTVNNGVVYLLIQNTTSSQATVEARRGFDGSILWKHQTTSNIVSADVTNQVLYTYAYLGSLPNPKETQLLALKISNGNLIWSQNIPDAHFDFYNYGKVTITYVQDTLLVDDGLQLCVYNTSNGSPLWCADPSPWPPSANPTQPQQQKVEIESYLAGDQKLYIAYVTNNSKSTVSQIQSSVQIKALDFQSGQPFWTSSALVNNGLLPFPLGDLVQQQQNTLLVSSGVLLAGLDAGDGRVLWQINEYKSPAVVQIVASAS